MRPPTTILCFFIFVFKAFSQTYEIDDAFLKSIDGKYFAFSYYDGEKERPCGLMFQLKYLSKDSSMIAKNIIAMSKWSKGTLYSGTSLTFTELTENSLVFNGSLKAKYSDGDSADVECKLEVKLHDKQKFETWLTLPNNRTVWGYCQTGNLAFAQGVIKKGLNQAATASNKKATQPVEFSDELSVMKYLEGKTFKSSSGTEVKIGNSSELNSYGIMINGKAIAFNLTYTPMTKYKAVIEDDVLTGGRIKVYVNSLLHTLENGGMVYTLK